MATKYLELIVGGPNQAHAELGALLDALPQGAFCLDAKGRFVSWNDPCAREQLFGYRLTAGASYLDLLRVLVDEGYFPGAAGRETEWLAERKSELNKPRSSAELYLKGGRWVRIELKRQADASIVGTLIDITDLKHRQDTGRVLFEDSPLPMWVMDIEAVKLVEVNNAAIAHYGYSREEFLSMSVLDLRPAEDREEFRQVVTEQRWSQGNVVRRHLKADGSIIHVAIYTRPIVHHGRSGWLAILVDITRRIESEQRVDHLVHHDALTDLPNRTAFNRRLTELLAEVEEKHQQFAIIRLDLDRFNEINDTFGYSVGDGLLRDAARYLADVAPTAFLARLGGDEFGVIVTAAFQPGASEQLAERLVQLGSVTFQIDAHPVQVTASAGIAIYPADGRTADVLLANAEAALNRAKREGGSRFHFFSPTMDQQIRERRELLRDLRLAVEQEQLAIFFQPQASTDGMIVGFEALARWHHPPRGFVPPNLFIPIAEDGGLILAIGDQILRQACREAASWVRPLRISVNLSPAQFRHGYLPTVVHAALLDSGLNPNRLELEITESVLIDDFSRALAILCQLRELGVRIATDDFGTGYSSLSYLQAFPFDRIKIDQTFTARLFQDRHSATIVRAILGLAHGLSIPVTAEGVETAEQLKFLQAEGCDEVQGYLIGRPEPIEQYAEVTRRDLNCWTSGEWFRGSPQIHRIAARP